MTYVLFYDVARLFHFVGLALGLGLALWGNALACSFFFKPVHDCHVACFQSMRKWLAVGFVLLWGSGGYLLYVAAGFEVTDLPPHMSAKLCIVGLLTLNALMIRYDFGAKLSHWVGYRLGDLPVLTQMRYAAFSGMALACWISSLILGVFMQLKVAEMETVLGVITPVFAICMVLAFFIAIVTPRIARLRDHYFYPRHAAHHWFVS